MQVAFSEFEPSRKEGLFEEALALLRPGRGKKPVGQAEMFCDRCKIGVRGWVVERRRLVGDSPEARLLFRQRVELVQELPDGCSEIAATERSSAAALSVFGLWPHILQFSAAAGAKRVRPFSCQEGKVAALAAQ